MQPVYRMAANCAYVIGWRKAKVTRGTSDHINEDALSMWQLRCNWIEKELLPSGSGFNSGTTFEVDKSTENKLVFHTSFHHMNEHGYYTKWTHHVVTVTPSLLYRWELKISGPNYNGIKDYIESCFELALNRETDWPEYL